MKQILVIFCLFAVSCNPANKLHKMMDKLPEASAKECAVRFPIKETIETVTVADTAMLHQYEMEFQYMAQMIDSLLIANCDTVKVEKIKNVITKIPCKPVVKYVIKTQENTAKQQVIIDSCQKLSSKLYEKLDITTRKLDLMTDKSDKYKRQRNRYFWLLITLLIWSLRKPIASLLKSL